MELKMEYKLKKKKMDIIIDSIKAMAEHYDELDVHVYRIFLSYGCPDEKIKLYISNIYVDKIKEFDNIDIMMEYVFSYLDELVQLKNDLKKYKKVCTIKG